MKRFARLIYIFFLSIIFIKTQAQQKHFIYIESEDKQPFAVVMNGKVYSSSDYGYVIIPKLTDGTYNFTVSFPMNKFPDQAFKSMINKKDVGYKLQNNAGKTWSLQNMQTQKVLNGNGEASAGNAFSNMLSDVINDSAQKNTVVNNAKPDTMATAAMHADTTATATQMPAADSLSQVSTLTTDSVAQLQKISEVKLDTGTNMVFVDKTSGADTINVFVPADSINNVQQKNIVVADSIAGTSQADAITAVNNEAPKPDSGTSVNPFYKPANESANTAPVILNPTTGKSKISDAVKQDCASMLSDNDMDKIKRKMFVQNNDNGMVQTALKYVGNKCITTDQVRLLGSIFSSDDGRYNLYDALYKYAYDYGNYANLESQIIDPYYKKRFEVMLR